MLFNHLQMQRKMHDCYYRNLITPYYPCAVCSYNYHSFQKLLTFRQQKSTIILFFNCLLLV